MKIGDIVKARSKFMTEAADYGMGIIIDVYEDPDGMEYFEVHWKDDQQWWKSYELELVSESG